MKNKGERGKRGEGDAKARKEKARLSSIAQCEAVIAENREALEFYKKKRDEPLEKGRRIGAKRDDYGYLLPQVSGVILKAQQQKDELEGLRVQEVSPPAQIPILIVPPKEGFLVKIATD